MDPSEALTAELAEEIRAAVAAAGPAHRPDSPIARGGSGTEEVRRTLERAEAFLTPTIPPGARLSRVKMLVLRALRFLWRDQTSFNALAVEAFQGLRDALDQERGRVETLGAQLENLRTDLQRELHSIREGTASWERRAVIQNGRLAALEATGASSPVPAVAAAAEELPAGLYSLFEERFRGTPEEIARRQSVYLPLLSDLPGPVLDVGCGRGEFLRLLQGKGVSVSGVERNPLAAEACRREGLAVEQADALEALARRPSASLGAVVAFQVVEHWPPSAVFAFLREARRLLAPGGLLIAETINTNSLSAWRAFFLDPSHVRPVPPELLRFLAEAAGLVDARFEFLSPLPAEEILEERSGNDSKLNRLLFAPQDYALIARAPGESA